jgi:hypothetical protein
MGCVNANECCSLSFVVKILISFSPELNKTGFPFVGNATNNISRAYPDINKY